MLTTPLVLVDCVVTLVIIQWCRVLYRNARRLLPPGPKGYLFVGNAFDMLSSELWEVGRKWGKVFGGMIYLKSFGKDIVMVNSYHTAVNLMEERALNYSDRPRLVMFVEMQRWDWLFSVLPYGEDWRKKRAPMQRFFDPPNITHYEDLRKAEIQKLFRALLSSPRDYDLHIRAHMASLIIGLVYGHDVRTPDDSYVTLAKEGFEYVSLALRPGAYLVDAVPLLKYVPKWLPGAGFQIVAEDGAKASNDMRYLPYNDARDKLFSGTGVRSFTSQQIEEHLGSDGKVSKSDEEIISASSGIFYVGGVDTSVTTFMCFFLAMTLYPEVQRRVQEEIDHVIGPDRLPGFPDQSELPYCAAMCKEILRWQPAVPLGLAHAAREEGMYAGYTIPAKTTVVPNQWAMLMDPEEYPEPEVFRPERFLPGHGKVQRDPGKIAFGFGRRICPAKQFAENNNLMTLVNILAVFNISKVVDDNGNPVEPNAPFNSDGIVRHIGRFECDIKPRSKAAEGLIAME